LKEEIKDLDGNQEKLELEIVHVTEKVITQLDKIKEIT